MATKVAINKSNKDMNRQFAQDYLNANTEEEYEQMAENWGISVEEIFDIIDLHPEYLDLVDDGARRPGNFSGVEVETEKDNGMLSNFIKPRDKTHLKKDEFITKKQTTSPKQYEKTSRAGSGNRGPDGSLLNGNRPLNFKAAADNKSSGAVDNKSSGIDFPIYDNKPIDGRSSLPVIEIIKAPEEVKPKAEPEERPGWHKQEGTNFWTINSESPYWKTEEGGMEAERLWGSRPSWVKQR